MRVFLLFVGLSACSSPSSMPSPATVDSSTDSYDVPTDGAVDASTLPLPGEPPPSEPPAEPPPSEPPAEPPPGEPPPSFTPSSANVGWIGGACIDAGACTDLPDARCLRDGFPNGTCTRSCAGPCPDRGGAMDTVSFCIDGAPYGEPSGLCVSRCDRALFPATGCPDGYACAPRNRYGNAMTVEDVCVPARTSACSNADEQIAIAYPEGGALWIPREARCGGDFDLVVMLHGINSTRDGHGWLGRGVRSELLIRALIDEQRMAPVILAEPVQVASSSSVLYGAAYDPVVHLDRLRPHLDTRGIRVRSLSYVGHSGAGCDASNGMYEVLDRLDDLVPSFAPTMPLWGLADICYAGDYKWQRPMEMLSSRDTAIVNVTTSGGDPTTFESRMLDPFRQATCDPVLMSSCKAHATRPWCSFRTTTAAGLNHLTNPYFYVREVFPRVFGDAGPPCR